MPAFKERMPGVIFSKKRSVLFGKGVLIALLIVMRDSWRSDTATTM